MIKLLPLLLAALGAYVMARFSAWRGARALDRQSHLLRDPCVLHEAGRLARALDLPQIEVHVLDTPAVNGLAVPDGRVFLTQGFLDRYRQGQVSAPELASVIAHELGHVALGHTHRRMIEFSGQNALRLMLMAVLARVLPGLGLIVANAVTGLLAAGLSRRDEYEADAWAAALLTKAGIGTAPQKSLFAKLGDLTGAAGAQGPAWLQSHPPTPDRIRAIETLESRWG